VRSFTPGRVGAFRQKALMHLARGAAPHELIFHAWRHGLSQSPQSSMTTASPGAAAGQYAKWMRQIRTWRRAIWAARAPAFSSRPPRSVCSCPRLSFSHSCSVS